MDPIAVVGLVSQCYGVVVQAYLFIQTAIAFPEAAARLVIQLEVERIRLQLWGRNSGADSDALRPGLAPFEPLILQILTKIQQLLCDSDGLKAKYGLSSSMDGVAGTVRAKMHGNIGLVQVVDRVKDNLRSAFAVTATDKGKKASGNMVGSSQPALRSSPDRPGLMRKGLDRLSWAIVSKSRFESLIVELRGFNNNLNELLRESQFLELSRQWLAIETHTIARSNNTDVLRALQEATNGDENCREIFSMAQNKTIIIAGQVVVGGESHSVEEIGKRMVLWPEDFELPADFEFSGLSRCIAVYKPRGKPSQGYVLIERKTFQDTMQQSFSLFDHHKLIQLVNLSLNQNLFCLGYWGGSLCWYFVYQFPQRGIAPVPSTLSPGLTPFQPLSLRLVLMHAPFRPPLETRLTLACALAASFLRFYGSKWLHKAVRSDNILFTVSSDGGGYNMTHPIVVGFTEFSRSVAAPSSWRPPGEGDSHSWDGNPIHPVLGPLPPEYGLYYHPAYLDRNQVHPYSMAFDIYSFGLLLLEVGWWVPLERIPGALQAARNLATAPLRQELITRVRKELAFNMGTSYKDVVEWCLTRDLGSDSDLAVEFCAKVVVPLSKLKDR